MARAMRPQKATSISIPAPTGGLNGRDAIANMPPGDAPIMDNWFPSTSSVQQRKGMVTWASGLPANVNTVATYNGSTITKMFAASGAGIYDVTITGAVGAPVVTGLTSSKFQYTQMGTIGGKFLLMFNGIDNGKYFDGTAWIDVSIGAGATQIAGVDPKTIINCNIFKNRLFLVQRDTANVWYLPINSIYGTAAKLDFSSLLKFGSNIIAMATWTVDNSAGMQEYAIFISNIGEILVYQGSDPSSATDWAIVARFYVGRPAGYRCYETVGSDLILIGADGVFPLSKALVTDRTQLEYAVSDKIVDLVTEDFAKYANNFGWQLKLYPIGSKLFLNVPAVDGVRSYQYVMNTTTGSWCKFTGWTAFSFALKGDDAFYGGIGKVYRCDYGHSDDGANITSDCQQAFQYMGTSKQKLFTGIRPIIQGNAIIRPAMAINVDYENKKPVNLLTFTQATYTPWFSPWFSPWSSELRVNRDWQSTTGLGFAGAPRILLACHDVQVEWQSTDIIFQVGHIL